MRLHVAYDSDEKIRCSFFTVVVRNKSLEKNYKGGLKGFIDEYGARCNHDIAVDYYMGGDVDDTVKDLLGNLCIFLIQVWVSMVVQVDLDGDMPPFTIKAK